MSLIMSDNAILVLNCGSSSFKYRLFDAAGERLQAAGISRAWRPAMPARS